MLRPFLLGFETGPRPDLEGRGGAELRPFLLGFETAATGGETPETKGSDRSFWDLKPKDLNARGLRAFVGSDRSFWDLKPAKWVSSLGDGL